MSTFISATASASLTTFLAATAILLCVGCSSPESRPAGGEVEALVHASLSSGHETFDHSIWSSLLAEGSHDGLIDYEVLESRRVELHTYLEAIAKADLASLAPQELKALLINAYNALTLESILLHPGVPSIKSISGVWDEMRHPVGGLELTLDEIEHNVLRPYFKDPRIHFVVNCASRSCAPLPQWAYEGEKLNDQLEEASRRFLGNPANARLERGRLRVSRYFDWYGTDFIAEDWRPRADSIAEFVARYTEGDIGEAVAADPAIKVSFLDYDWALNSAKQGQVGLR